MNPHSDEATGPGRRQKGIALTITLGFLALLMVFAMSFAYQAQTDQQVAAVSADLLRARLLAESGLERVIGMLSHHYGQFTSGGSDAQERGLYPGDSFYRPTSGDWQVWAGATTSPWGGRCAFSTGTVTDGLDQALASTIPVLVAGSTELYDFTPEDALHTNAGSIPITVFDDTTNETSIVGLVSYVTIDESGKLDPSALVNGSDDEGASDSYTRDSMGMDVTEIRLGNAGDSTTWDTLSNFLREVSGGGTMPTSSRWRSIKHIASTLDCTQAQTDMARQRLHPYSYDLEAWYDWNSASSSGQDWHRFDLSSFPWNTAAFTDLQRKRVSGTQDVWHDHDSDPTTPDAMRAAPDIANDPTHAGIPWLSNAGFNNPVQPNQVAANLFDFCDSDDYATNDYVPGGTPTYVGCDRTPYVNEVFVGVQYTAHQDTIVISLVPYFAITVNRYEIDVRGQVEYANMYDTQITVPRAEVVLEMCCNYGTTPQPIPLSFVIPSTTVNANSYATSAEAAPITGTQTIRLAPPVGGGLPDLTNFIVDSMDVACGEVGGGGVITGSTLYDYSQIGAMPTGGDIAPATVTPDFTWCSVEVDDPRHNLVATETTGDNWIWNAAGWSASTGAAGTPDVVNSNLTINSAGHDAEPDCGGDPVDPGFSTAFIRNGPPQGFWELGAIHRGARWETLNLHSSTGSAYASPDGSYSDGDWPLLDQVKLSSVTERRGRINCNSLDGTTWLAVLRGLCVEGSYDTPCPAGGHYINLAQASAVANGIAAFRIPGGANDRRRFAGRGEIARVPELSDGTCGGTGTQDTDRAMEEIIGKIAGLLTARSNYFSVLVSAKAVRDLGAIPATVASTFPDAIEWQAGYYCRPLGEQKILATVYRDSYWNRFVIERFEYLEE